MIQMFNKKRLNFLIKSYLLLIIRHLEASKQMDDAHLALIEQRKIEIPKTHNKYADIAFPDITFPNEEIEAIEEIPEVESKNGTQEKKK
jgi:hypothetical protein